jgi:hypothetical protein
VLLRMTFSVLLQKAATIPPYRVAVLGRGVGSCWAVVAVQLLTFTPPQAGSLPLRFDRTHTLFPRRD